MKTAALLVLPLLAGCGAQIGPSFSSLPDGTIDTRNGQGPNGIPLIKAGDTENTTELSLRRHSTRLPVCPTAPFATSGTSVAVAAAN